MKTSQAESDVSENRGTMSFMPLKDIIPAIIVRGIGLRGSMSMTVEKVFNSSLYWFSLVGSLLAAIYLLIFPSTAWALAILAIPPIAIILREPMSERQKAFWAMISILLIVGVHRGLSKDQKAQVDAQNQIVSSFKEIGQQIASSNTENEKQFAKTAASFSRTTDELGKIVTLESENLKNTTPRAVMAYESIYPVVPVSTANVPYSFNVTFSNIGNDIASDLFRYARIYVAKLDDEADQREFLRDFNGRWKDWRLHSKKGVVVTPWYPRKDTFSFNETFSNTQIQQLNDHTKTFYYLIRIEYSDHTGRWQQDFCGGIQDLSHPALSHQCIVGSKLRRPVQ